MDGGLTMPLGRTSTTRLAECDPRLVAVIRAVADGVDRGDLATAGIRDITVLTGHRGEADQNAAHASGASRLRWPHSRHNSTPSMAVDIAPYPIDWADERAFWVLRGYVLATAATLRVALRVISWDGPHFELPR